MNRIEGKISIRKYLPEDRPALRDIAYSTAFMGDSAEIFCDDKEVLADLLTMYFTDYEPESCFVGVADDKVVGYLIGARDEDRLNKKMLSRIIPGTVVKMFRRGTFLRAKNISFLLRMIWSSLKGEFLMPDYSKNYPAILHINILERFRSSGLGAQLVGTYKEYLKVSGVGGVHLVTMSEKAGQFFEKMGFSVLFQGKRTYLEYGHRRPVKAYVYGQKL